MTRTIPKIDWDASRTPSFLTVFTLILWLACLLVGFIGFVFPYMRPKSHVTQTAPIQAELIKVELTATELSPETDPQRVPVPQPSDATPLGIPEVPSMIAVAEPLPEVAFALPIEAPLSIVGATSENLANTVEQATAATPVQTLTFGSGEGKQPAPDYPVRARREGQEGVVLVRFTVGKNGRVLSAEAASPSPWSLLNESAVRTVRERWRFAPDGLRLYEVAIRFQMRN